MSIVESYFPNWQMDILIFICIKWIEITCGLDLDVLQEPHMPTGGVLEGEWIMGWGEGSAAQCVFLHSASLLSLLLGDYDLSNFS